MLKKRILFFCHTTACVQDKKNRWKTEREPIATGKGIVGTRIRAEGQFGPCMLFERE